MKHPYVKKLVIFVAMSVLLFSMLLAKVYLNNLHSFNAAERALQEKATEKAIANFEQSIRWYVPLNPRTKKAVQHLWDLGRMAEEQHDLELALDVYARLRSSLYSIQSCYLPYKAWIDLCDMKIDHLFQFHEKSDRAKSRSEEQLAKVANRPQSGWSAFLEFGFWGWVLATIAFLYRTDLINGGFAGKSIFRWGLIIALLYCAWLVSMLKL